MKASVDLRIGNNISLKVTAPTTPAGLATAGIMVSAIVLAVTALVWAARALAQRIIEDAREFGPVRLCAGRLLGVDLLAARTPERVELQLGRLVGGADPGVPDPHPALLFSKPVR